MYFVQLINHNRVSLKVVVKFLSVYLLNSLVQLLGKNFTLKLKFSSIKSVLKSVLKAVCKSVLKLVLKSISELALSFSLKSF